MKTSNQSKITSVYRDQNVLIRAVLERAGDTSKVLCLAPDYAKRKHLALICDGSGDIPKATLPVENNPAGIDFLIKEVSAPPASKIARSRSSSSLAQGQHVDPVRLHPLAPLVPLLRLQHQITHPHRHEFAVQVGAEGPGLHGGRRAPPDDHPLPRRAQEMLENVCSAACYRALSPAPRSLVSATTTITQSCPSNA